MLANPEIGNAYFFQLPGQTAVAGYGIVTVGNDHEVGGKKAFLTDFYFDTTYRGQGFGFQALELIEEQCRLQGIQALELQVLTSNPRAHALYTKSGYKAYERIPMIKVF
jgi:ribosomal protein S18 acetylase RimI-like enzyme